MGGVANPPYVLVLTYGNNVQARLSSGCKIENPPEGAKQKRKGRNRLDKESREPFIWIGNVSNKISYPTNQPKRAEGGCLPAQNWRIVYLTSTMSSK